MSVSAEAYNALGNVAFRVGDFIKARALYSQAVATDSSVVKFHTNHANAAQDGPCLASCGGSRRSHQT